MSFFNRRLTFAIGEFDCKAIAKEARSHLTSHFVNREKNVKLTTIIYFHLAVLFTFKPII